MDPAALAGALANHDRVKRSTDLPLFYGVKGKDVITAHQLIDRIDRAGQVGGWDDARKCLELNLILREEGLLWWQALDDEPIDDIEHNWPELKKAFIKAYAPKYTPKATCNIFVELQQRSGESVQSYYLRVHDGFKRMCDNMPPDLATTVTAPLLAVAAVVDPGLTEAQALVYKTEGIRQLEKYFLRQLLVAGMKEEIRTKVMEAGLNTINETMNLARETETIITDRKKSSHVAAVQDDQNEDQDEGDVNAIRGKDGKFRKGPYKPNQNGSGEKKQFQGNCRYCKKWGHSQKICRDRKEKGAALVDAKGVPYKTQHTTAVQEEEKEENKTTDLASLSFASLNF